MFRSILGSAVLACVAFGACAQQAPWESYSQHIKNRSGVSELKGDLFGESVDLYNGRVSFKVVDVELEGSSSLPVRVARKLSLRDPVVLSETSLYNAPMEDQSFADWTLDIPRITGVFARQLQGNVLGPNGIDYNPQRTYSWSDQRCSGQRVPPVIGEFFASDYWSGLNIEMDGGGELLAPSSGLPSPSVGGPYRWVTTGRVWVSCLPSIRNGSGEGFLAVGPDGTKYWFDWMAEFYEPPQRKSFYYSIQTPTGGFEEVYEQELIRKMSALYVTKVEDRFGNWVSYSYVNGSQQAVRIEKIESSDGRKITFTTSPNGRISSVASDGRVWNYGYTASGDALTSVTLPDGSAWQLGLSNYSKSLLLSQQYPASCNYPGAIKSAVANAVLTMKHPSGASAEFEFAPTLHGRSSVPKQCLADPLSDGPEYGADYSDYVRFYWVNSLVRKKISGPGIDGLQWTYQYNGSQLAAQARSLWNYSPNYIPPGSWVAGPYTWIRLPDDGQPLNAPTVYSIIDPKCNLDSCASYVSTDINGPAGFERHTYGNTYRYNEHKLIRIERGAAPSSVLRTDELQYDLNGTGQPFVRTIGATRQYKGEGLINAVVQPLKRSSVKQDGTIFTKTIDTFDVLARPLSVTATNSPSP
ncbi:hypothetical protein VA603_06240 [Stenotrophomonas sp. MH1]|uniref:Uncharacterized protein n=1 Tax=Stenotrophomonas capsici TaxID=3110230 RepID=A0ABU5V1B0_9GAMM|nr:hypothetical protein [Stenotrophomonas sp. MH1]MEA5667134.1 hypothetical protein [Stenotrophomonas sp. MH1]